MRTRRSGDQATGPGGLGKRNPEHDMACKTTKRKQTPGSAHAPSQRLSKASTTLHVRYLLTTANLKRRHDGDRASAANGWRPDLRTGHAFLSFVAKHRAAADSAPIHAGDANLPDTLHHPQGSRPQTSAAQGLPGRRIPFVSSSASGKGLLSRDQRPSSHPVPNEGLPVRTMAQGFLVGSNPAPAHSLAQ